MELEDIVAQHKRQRTTEAERQALRTTRRADKARQAAERAAKEAQIAAALRRNPTSLDAVRTFLATEPRADRRGQPLRAAPNVHDSMRAETETFLPFLETVWLRAPKLLDSMSLDRMWHLHRSPHIRPIDGWQPRGRGRERLFRSLADHLLGRYRMPPFLYNVFDGDQAGIRLFCHLAQGGSVVQAAKTGLLPVSMTKRMCHLFLRGHPGDDVARAVRRAQVTAFGGSPRLLDAIAESFLRDFVADEHFWSTVIRWLCASPMLDPSRVGPMLDYIRFRRNGANGRHFSMHGRTAAALLRDAETWHAELPKQETGQRREFKPSGFAGGKWVEGPEDHPVMWGVREILTVEELIEEGRTMRHCVLSYSARIFSRAVSIWSIRREDQVHGARRQLTVELDNPRRRVVQARGYCNRLPTDTERRILQCWARSNGIAVASDL